jgi:hypothetical protein
MKEEILKYFTNKLPQESTEVMPQNIDTTVTSDFLSDMRLYTLDTVSNDGNYFIRYGGYPRTDQYDVGGIDVFTIDSIKKEQPIYSFYNLRINGHGFVVRDLHQDENGRFYGIGNYINENLDAEYYLIIFNNFIQDGYIQIRKFYTQSQMGISANESFSLIVKRENAGEYFIISTSNNKVYKFKIDIVNGNSLETYNYSDLGTLSTGTLERYFNIIDNKLIYLESFNDSDNTKIEEKKLTINIDEEPTGTYYLRVVHTLNKGNNILLSTTINNFKFYEPILVQSGNNYIFNFNIVDFNGNIKTVNCNTAFNGNETLTVEFDDNYVTLVDRTNNKIKLYYYKNESEIINFYSGDFSGTLNQIQILKQYNLSTIIGINSRKSLAFITNLYSIGYSSTPYTNKNFLIPQYLNLYSEEVENVNSNDSIIYSRDAINRFLAGNQLTATFNIPNYLLNDSPIKTERVLGQTNMSINNNLNTIQKNRFESLFYTYIQNLLIIDNTNGNNQQNMTASNRLSNSIWNKLDIENSACLKIRVTDENGDYIIRDIDSITINDTEATLEYYVEGNVKKIEYLSNDLQTVYATYRCDLTVEEYGLLTEDGIELLTEDGIELEGATTNTIEQTINVV